MSAELTSTTPRYRAMALGFALAALGCTADEPPQETWLLPRAAPAIRGLAVRTTTPFEPHELQGRVTMLSFGYTSCADVCPTTLSTMGRVLRRLGEDAASARALYISIDPERDTPDVFRQFLQVFDERIEGIFIPRDNLDVVMQAYGIVATRGPISLRRYVGGEIDPVSDYSMDHTTGLWLVDSTGTLRVRYTHDASSELIARGVASLIHD